MQRQRDSELTFQPTHQWEHTPAPASYKPGDHVLAKCACGAESVGEADRSGKLIRVDTRGGDSLYCPFRGVDNRGLKTWARN